MIKKKIFYDPIFLERFFRQFVREMCNLFIGKPNGKKKKRKKEEEEENKTRKQTIFSSEKSTVKVEEFNINE